MAFSCPNPAPSPSTTRTHHAEIPSPSLAPQNEVSPQHCKIRVLYRKTLAKIPQSIPKQAPPSHLCQCHPQASRLQPPPPPPPMLTPPTFMLHLTPANLQFFIRDHSYKYLNTCPIKSPHPHLSPAPPPHLISSLLPRFYCHPLPNPRIRIMLKYKQFIIIGSIITPILTCSLVEVGCSCTMDFEHRLCSLDRFFVCSSLYQP